MANMYQQYKDTNASWISIIPKHWDLQRISRVFRLRKEKNDPIRTDVVLSLSAKYGVTLQSKKLNIGGNKPKEDMSAYHLCYPNDILVNCMNVILGSVGISQYFGAVSPVYYSLVTLDSKLTGIRYLEYVFRSSIFQQSLIGVGKGILAHRMRISWDLLKIHMLPIPTKYEQIKIADFLDWKLNEIDKLISIKNDTIIALKKLKQAFIDNIFGNCNTVDYVPLYKLGIIMKGLGVAKSNLTPSKFKALLYGDIYTKYNYWFDKCISTIDEQTYNNVKKIKKGTVVFTACGESRDDIAKAVSYEGEEEIAIGDAIIALVPNADMRSKYIAYYFNSSIAKYHKYVISTGDIITNISMRSIRKLKVPIVDRNIQDQIIKELDTKLKNLDESIQENLQLIDSLNQLKSILISNVVTGQIDIRNIKIPEYSKD